MGWRCGAPGGKRSASGRLKISPGTRGGFASPPISNSSAVRNGGQSATATACALPKSGPTVRPSCTGRSPRTLGMSFPLSPRSDAGPGWIYEALLLLSPGAEGDLRIAGALARLVSAFTVDRIQRANLMVDRDEDKKTPAEAACWLDPTGCVASVAE